MLPFAATAPGLFGASTLCSPSICADVHATVRSRLEEGDVDGIVRSRFSSAKSAASAPAGPGSRLLLQMSEVRTMTGESDPLAALTSLLREVGELRELQNRLLQSTNQMSVEAALDSIEDAMRALTELKEAEKVMGATLGLDGWRAVAAEVEAARHLEARIRAFAGVHSKDGGSLEAALRTLQHRERERLSLIQLRNDVLVPDEADEGGAVDEVEEAEPQDDEETLTFGQRAWRRVGHHMALLTGAEAANAGGDAAIEIRTRSTPKAVLIGTDTTHALCTIEVGEAAWDAVHAELKALVALDGAVPGVLKVFGWYERRLSGAPPVRPSSTVEVSVATEMMLGGDLLQRACVAKYTAGHVCALARQLVSAVSALQAAGVTRVDLAPWSLLYRTPPKGPLAAGLVITNAGFGVPARARNATSSLRAAFDPPELHGTSTSAPPGAARSATSAVWQLGTLMRLLLTGMMETDSSADALTSVALREAVPLEPDATALLQALCDPTPGKRAELAQISTYRWMHAHDDGKPDDLPLTEAQEGLNRWYDAFLFEGMAARLARMSSD